MTETYNECDGPQIDAEWADLVRGPPHVFDQETLDALRDMPQPPDDDECERRWT